MSDFYSGRRTLLADIGGLLGLGLGAIVAALTVWKVLATGFRTGEMEKAFATFLAAVLGAAALGGLAGLGVGRWAGGRWEQTHRGRRPTTAVVAADPPSPPAPRAATLSTFATRPLGAEASRALALVQPSVPGAVPWGAWDGPRLVAVAWVSGAGGGVQVAHAVTDAGYDVDRMVREIRDAVTTSTS